MMQGTLADRDGWMWLDGELIPWRDAKVHVLSHSLHYGMGVFEGLRAYDTLKGVCIFRLAEHTRRLHDSAHIMGMKLPFSWDELLAAQKQVVVANGLTECYIRPICYFGAESLSLSMVDLTTHVAIGAWPWPSYMAPEARETGIRVRTSSFTRHHINITMCRAKNSGHYVNSLLALKEAQDSGCDEAMLLDNEGYVSEGSGENLFIVRDGVLHTPELASCLPGITRDAIFYLARDLGLKVVERRFTRDEVYVADEAFFTGTAVEVLPIRELDSRQIGTGGRGILTEKLQSLFFDQVRGKRAAHPEWLTPVSA